MLGGNSIVKIKITQSKEKTMKKWALSQLIEGDRDRERVREIICVIIFNCLIGLTCIQIAENEHEHCKM